MRATGNGGGSDVGRLELLASAIAGRPLEVVAGEVGAAPWTDGVVVFVDGGASRRDQTLAMVVQASLVAAGSIDAEVLAPLRRHGSAAQRYLAVEGHRALVAHEALLPVAVRSLLDRATAARSDSPAASLALALGRAPLPAPPAAFGTLRPRQVRTAEVPGVSSDAQDPAARHVPRAEREQLLRELDDGEDAEVEGAFDMFNPVGGGGAVGRLLQRLLGNARSTGAGQPGADAPTHRTTSGGRTRSTGAAVSTATSSLPDDLSGRASRGTTYPEWNVHERRYRADWCTVIDREPEPAPVGRELPVPPDAHALRRPLARLGLELERRRRQAQGDDIDVDALVDARAALAAGCPPDEAIYVDTVRRRRDLSVLILLDVSGSAGEPSATGVTVHEHQRAAAAGLAVALHDLGDRVALYGFRSRGRAAVEVLPVKRFGDGFDAQVLRRLGGLVPGAYTRLGAAIRHGASVLETEGGTARRLLVVLSDGFAYDHGYDGRYGEADARRALAEARRRGTACLCLSIAADTDVRALRRVFGTAAHATLPHARELPATVGPMFRAALRLAAQQRRTAQRRQRTRDRLQIDRIERRTA